MKKKNVLIASVILFIILLISLSVYSYEKVFLRLKSGGYLNESVDIEEIDNAKGTMVALTFGQSNSANSGESRYTPHNRILNYSDSSLYVASDPLIGTGGKGGSVWGILGDMLVDRHVFKKVIIIPIGRGSTSITCWADSACHLKLVSTLEELNRKHIKVTHIFWHQGESDLGTSKEHYKEQLTKILSTIRRHGQTAPFYCSIATYNPGLSNVPVASAQAEFIRENQNVLYGPNTDLITSTGDRWQKVHFTEQGMNKYATAWFNAIINSKE